MNGFFKTKQVNIIDARQRFFGSIASNGTFLLMILSCVFHALIVPHVTGIS
jgi:hypothetical protein